MIRELIRDIRIHPSFLGKDKMRKHLFDELIKQTKGECTEEIGYIIRVLEIKNIIDNTIENSSSDIVITVSFLVEVFKPVIGDVHDGVVIASFSDGALVNIQGVQKIMIPATKLKAPLKTGAPQSVKITAIRYNDHVFSCIGEPE